jgi:asparaginyl-tRNA synthetase
MYNLKAKQTTVPVISITDLPKQMDQLSSKELERKALIGKIMTRTLQSLTSTYVNAGFEWLLPVALSRSTDPLWPDPNASIETRIEVDIYGKPVRTTASMIVHKLVAQSLVYPKLFVLSPNIRIEKSGRSTTGRHLYEFTQLDFEIQGATSKDVFTLVEGAIKTLLTTLKKEAKPELTVLGRYDSLKIPKTPFKVYDSKDLEKEYGADWEAKITDEIKDPVWITNLPREFYDYEDYETGRWDNYDLFLPQFGETLSGAKREWEYTKILEKMERESVRKENYSVLLKLAKAGKIKPSAGAGIGIERIVAWITGVQHIGEVQPFPRVPGAVHEL